MVTGGKNCWGNSLKCWCRSGCGAGIPNTRKRFFARASRAPHGSGGGRTLRLAQRRPRISGGDQPEPAGDGRRRLVSSAIRDITERKHLEKTILDISAREQRRIGQDLHDGLGQHLTGIAFMSKVQEQKLMEKGLAEAGDAAKIVNLVNEADQQDRGNWRAACFLSPYTSGKCVTG